MQVGALFDLQNATIQCHPWSNLNDAAKAASQTADLSVLERFDGADGRAILIHNFCQLCLLLRADWPRVRTRFVLLGWLTEDNSMHCNRV